MVDIFHQDYQVSMRERLHPLPWADKARGAARGAQLTRAPFSLPSPGRRDSANGCLISAFISILLS